jgi:uncharacterized protein (TIGR03435 family)
MKSVQFYSRTSEQMNLQHKLYTRAKGLSVMPGPLNGNRKSLILTVVLIALTSAASFAQSTPPAASAPHATDASAKAPEFDDISIRPNKNLSQIKDGIETQTTFVRDTPDGFSARNYYLKSLIFDAYGLKQFYQIVGGPNWIDFEGFDIEAKVVVASGSTPQPLTRELRKQMLRSLLADRFKLAVHNETRQLPVYQLVLAKNGPKFQPANPGEKFNESTNFSGMLTMLTLQNLQISALTGELSSRLSRPVLDKTGLTGKYDIKLEWARDTGPTVGKATADSASGPSIFTAVQEQLGLKLEPAKAPVDVIVIDHVEPPTEN